MKKNKYLIPNTFTSVKQHLAFDDSIHNTLNDTQSSDFYLRLWEPNDYAIVLGKSNKENIEVNIEQSKKDNINIIQRPSGGGTVLLGPGCLCYTLFIPINYAETFQSIKHTNDTILSTHCQALSKLVDNISYKGLTDLCIGQKKFSGNAQRRKKHTILYHGTFLYNYDIDQITSYLKHPSKEPEYRQERPHKDFLTNIPLSSQDITNALIKAWNIQKESSPLQT